MMLFLTAMNLSDLKSKLFNECKNLEIAMKLPNSSFNSKR